MIITQFFMTLSFIGVFVSLILVLLYFLCGGPDQKHFLILIKVRQHPPSTPLAAERFSRPRSRLTSCSLSASALASA
jgi:hypothetical protein